MNGFSCEAMLFNDAICHFQVTRLLMAVESGQINKWRDKQLEDITLEGHYYTMVFFVTFESNLFLID
jgi:hypothetical protein